MYCGMKDREPKVVGTPRCEWMHNAEQAVIEYGGAVERFIEDPEGGHADFLLTDAYYEDAIGVWRLQRYGGIIVGAPEPRLRQRLPGQPVQLRTRRLAQHPAMGIFLPGRARGRTSG